MKVCKRTAMDGLEKLQASGNYYHCLSQHIAICLFYFDRVSGSAKQLKIGINSLKIQRLNKPVKFYCKCKYKPFAQGLNGDDIKSSWPSVNGSLLAFSTDLINKYPVFS